MPKTRRVTAPKKRTPVATADSDAKVKALSVKAGEKLLAKGLKDLPDAYVQCRDIRHSWYITADYHEVPYTHVGRKLQALRRDLACHRCPCTRAQYFVNGRYGITKLSDDTKRPRDYSIRGVPRGVRQSVIVQQEAYRRAVERATGATPGQRATAER
jgi:hypothetical protein